MREEGRVSSRLLASSTTLVLADLADLADLAV
jgi:hypothetical protein